MYSRSFNLSKCILLWSAISPTSTKGVVNLFSGYIIEVCLDLGLKSSNSLKPLPGVGDAKSETRRESRSRHRGIANISVNHKVCRVRKEATQRPYDST